MKLGIIREEKNPPDKRVPLIPAQCKSLMEKYPSGGGGAIEQC